jgi:hypothetical protein
VSVHQGEIELSSEKPQWLAEKKNIVVVFGQIAPKDFHA